MDALTRNLMMAVAAQGSAPTMPTLRNVTRGANLVGEANPVVAVSLSAGTGGRLIVAITSLLYFGGSPNYASALTCSGNAMTEISACRASYNFFVGQVHTQAWWRIDTTSSGSTNFAFTANAGAYACVGAFDLVGVDTVSPIGATAIKQGSGTNQTFSLITGQDDSYAICALGGVGYPGTAASGVMEDFDSDLDGSNIIIHWGGSRAAPTAGGYTMGATVAALDGIEGAAGAGIEVKGA